MDITNEVKKITEALNLALEKGSFKIIEAKEDEYYLLVLNYKLKVTKISNTFLLCSFDIYNPTIVLANIKQKLSKEIKDTVLTFKVTKTEYEDFNRRLKENGDNRSKVIRNLINRYTWDTIN